MDKIVVICGTLLCLGILAVAVLDMAHKRVILHACQIAVIEARYPSADAALICNLK